MKFVKTGIQICIIFADFTHKMTFLERKKGFKINLNEKKLRIFFLNRSRTLTKFLLNQETKLTIAKQQNLGGFFRGNLTNFIRRSTIRKKH